MISLHDASITDCLPRVLTELPEVQALAYAVKRQMGRLLDKADGSRSYGIINTLGGAMLDILAVELRVRNYRQDYALTVKRNLVKGALAYWQTAGTVQSIVDVCKSIFGDAEITEWFDYDGKPGYFRVTTTNPEITYANVTKFETAVRNVKRLAAWLDRVELVLSSDPLNVNIAFVVNEGGTESYIMDPS